MNNKNCHPFYQAFAEKVSQMGGMFNAHLHLDRVFTLDEKYMRSSQHRIMDNSHISLHKKHSLINSLHDGEAFEAESLSTRVNLCLDQMIQVNTFRADTMVDVTADRVGLSALDTLLEIKQNRSDDIDLQLAAYSPFGFRDDEPERWNIFEEGVAKADFIGALPEADDVDDYPQHIGFEEHCRRMIQLSIDHQKPVHVHTDQRNEPVESGTERLLQVVKEFAGEIYLQGEPKIWAVHMISPSTYDEARFQRLVRDLLECNVGVICCPSAAIGMRQIRPISTPTYNSIPRVLELLEQGVQLRLASDNIGDICSPTTTADLTDEVFTLSAAIRFYNVDILAKLAAGQSLNDADREFIREHLNQNDKEIEKLLGELSIIESR